MFDKNHLMGNVHLSAQETGDFAQRIIKEHPELQEGVEKLLELLPKEVYQRAFSKIQTFNHRGDALLIVSGGILQRSFLERDCIPALKEAFQVKKVQIIG